MFTDEEKARLLSLLNQVLPPNAEVMVAVREKVATGNFDLTDDERSVLDGLLQSVEYKGKANEILILMEQINSMRIRLAPTPQGTVGKKKAKHKPAVEKEVKAEPIDDSR